MEFYKNGVVVSVSMEKEYWVEGGWGGVDIGWGGVVCLGRMFMVVLVFGDELVF